MNQSLYLSGIALNRLRSQEGPRRTSFLHKRLNPEVILRHHYELVAKDIAALCPEGKLLEVGSGAGQLLIALRRRSPSLQLSGIDLSSAMVEKARMNLAAAEIDGGKECEGHGCGIAEDTL